MAIKSGIELREIEDRLLQVQFHGVPIGSAMAQLLYGELFLRNYPWNMRQTCKDWLRFHYHRLQSRTSEAVGVDSCRGRILVTSVTPNYRITELMFPIARQLGGDRCVLICGQPEMADILPRGIVGIDANQTCGNYDYRAWRREYQRVWFLLRPIVKHIVRDYQLPYGTFYRFADAVVDCTKWIVGCQEFLRRAEPAAIVTEYDRNDFWAPLVLAAKEFNIPTYTLMHGVMGDMYDGFYRLLADKIFCWGEISADAMAAIGVERNKILLGGCPRLTRDLPISAAEAKRKMGLVPDQPVALLATQNFSWAGRLLQAETFCKAAEANKNIQAAVRLHPMDDLQGYSDLIARYPTVRFQQNADYSLEESIAAADVVVVHSSGFGSDALVKRRFAIVLDACDEPLNHGRELIDQAGVPRATSVDTLSKILHGLLFDEQERDRQRQLAEKYVKRFCAYFGEDSTKYIAKTVCDDIFPKGGSTAHGPTASP